MIATAVAPPRAVPGNNLHPPPKKEEEGAVRRSHASSGTKVPRAMELPPLTAGAHLAMAEERGGAVSLKGGCFGGGPSEPEPSPSSPTTTTTTFTSTSSSSLDEVQELRRLLSAETEDGDRRRSSKGWADAEEASELRGHNAALRLEVGSLRRALSRSVEEKRRMKAEFKRGVSTEKKEDEEDEDGASWEGAGATGLAIDCMSSPAASSSTMSTGRSIVSSGGAGGGDSDLSGSWRAVGRTELAIAQRHGDGLSPSNTGRPSRGSAATVSITSSWEPAGASGALMSHGSRPRSGGVRTSGEGDRGTATNNGVSPCVGFAFPPMVEYTPMRYGSSNDGDDNYDEDYDDDDLQSCLSDMSGMSSLTGTTAFALRTAASKVSRLMRDNRSEDGRQKYPADNDASDELRRICSDLHSALTAWDQEENTVARSWEGPESTTTTTTTNESKRVGMTAATTSTRAC